MGGCQNYGLFFGVKTMAHMGGERLCPCEPQIRQAIINS